MIIIIIPALCIFAMILLLSQKPQPGDVRAGGGVDGRVPARLGFQGGASIETLYNDYDYDIYGDTIIK